MKLWHELRRRNVYKVGIADVLRRSLALETCGSAGKGLTHIQFTPIE